MAVNLDYIVSSFLADLGDYSSTNYDRYLNYAVRGFKKLNIMVLPSIKVVYLPLNANNTIDLPKDYVCYSKIGVSLGGNIWTLTLNPNMVLPHILDDCGNTIAATNTQASDLSGNFLGITGLDGCYYVPHWRAGNYVGELYGKTGGKNTEGYFRVDEQNNQIAFTNVIQGEIILEYKSNGIETDGSAVVPEQAIEAMLAFVYWASIANDRKVGLGEKQIAWDRFTTEYELLKRFTNMFTASEYLDMVYSTSKSTVKRGY